jgi:hypothetical protein
MTLPVSRRNLLKVTAGAAVGTGMGLSGPEPLRAAGRREPAKMAAQRQKAKARRRRLIYNSDGCDVMDAGAGTPEGFLARRFKPALGTQVDSVFYCTGATTMFSHLGKVGETYGEFVPDGAEAMAVRARDNIRALKAAGHDVMDLAVNFCRRSGLEIFFSHRINDIHDTFLDWELSRWKREHPEYLLGVRGSAPPDGNSPRHWWSALDFERPEVREYLCRIEEDVCARYDVDGVEIDYWRSPMFFRPNLDLRPATPSQLEILTGFQRRLREITLREGMRRGRPILMAVRTPVTTAACRHVGIDIARWLEDDLADVLTVGGGYVPFTEPLEEIIGLAHRHNVPVYPTISASGMRGPDNRYATLEAWRGAAANMWRAGADGIVAFNLFPEGPEPRFMEIGSPETLAGRDKLFVIDPTAVVEGDLAQGAVQTQILPVAVPADGKTAIAYLPIGDDLPAAAQSGKLKSAELRIRLSDSRAVGAVEVKLNGVPLAPAERDEARGWLTFKPGGSLYRAGRNELAFRAAGAPGSSGVLTRVVAVEAHVDYL